MWFLSTCYCLRFPHWHPGVSLIWIHDRLLFQMICAWFFFQIHLFFWHMLPSMIWCLPASLALFSSNLKPFKILIQSCWRICNFPAFPVLSCVMPHAFQCSMWNILLDLVSCFSSLKTWANYYFLWEAIFCDSHSNLLLFPLYFPIISCAFSYCCIYRLYFHSIFTCISLLDRKISRKVSVFIYVFLTQTSIITCEI